MNDSAALCEWWPGIFSILSEPWSHWMWSWGGRRWCIHDVGL